MKSRKLVAAALVAVMSLSLFAGCTKPGEADPKNPGADLPKEEGGKRRTDIVIGQSSDVTTDDPYQQNDIVSARVIRLMYDTLVYTDPNGVQQPSLAESWEFVTDTEVHFKIREGVKFHDGSILTAEDVKFSIERQQQMAKVKAFVSAITEVRVEDGNTVVMTTATPYAPLLYNLSLNTASIVSRAYVEAAEASTSDERVLPMGTGPMKFKSWAPNDKYIVESFSEYWGKKPIATTVEMRVIPEASSRTIALETGEIDMLEGVSSIDVPKVRENKKLTTISQPSTGMSYVSFNLLKEPYNDVRVRKALSFATNKQNIIDVVCEGYGIELNTIFPTTMPGQDATLNLYPYSVEKAKALLTEAGFGDGLTLRVATSGDERGKIAQLMQSDYALVGVDLKIDLLEWGAYIDAVSGKDHDMFIIGWALGSEPDATAMPLFHSTSGGATGNRSWYANPEMDALIEKGRGTIKWEEREPIYKEIQRIAMEDAVWIPLYAKETVIAMNSNLKGVVIDPAGNHQYPYAYVEGE